MFDESKKTKQMATTKKEAGSEDTQGTAGTANGEAGTQLPDTAPKNEVAKTDANANIKEMFAYAKGAKGIEITADYLDLSKAEVDKPVIYIFMGMTTFKTPDGKIVPAVYLIDENEVKWILGSTVVVTALEKISGEVPVAVSITVHGKERSATGSYFDCTVKRF